MEIRNGNQEIRLNGEIKKAILEVVFDRFIIYVFKGTLSQFDILIKYKENDTRIRTPKHIHWVVDILLKQSKNRELTNDFLKLLQNCWNNCVPLTNNDFETIKNYINRQWELLDFDKYIELNNYGEYPIDFLFVLMNLLSVQEKTNRADAYMFGSIIDELLEDELDIFSIVSTAGFRGR